MKILVAVDHEYVEVRVKGDRIGEIFVIPVERRGKVDHGRTQAVPVDRLFDDRRAVAFGHNYDASCLDSHGVAEVAESRGDVIRQALGVPERHIPLGEQRIGAAPPLAPQIECQR